MEVFCCGDLVQTVSDCHSAVRLAEAYYELVTQQGAFDGGERAGGTGVVT